MRARSRSELSQRGQGVSSFLAPKSFSDIGDRLPAWGGMIRASTFQNRQDSQPRRRDSDLCIWKSDPLHSLARKREFDAVRWSTPTRCARPPSIEMRKFPNDDDDDEDEDEEDDGTQVDGIGFRHRSLQKTNQCRQTRSLIRYWESSRFEPSEICI